MKKLIFNKRGFLNKPGQHSTAIIMADIEDCSDQDWGDDFWGRYKMSDCENVISISIDLGSVSEVDNTLYKLDKIINTTKSFREKIANLRPKIKEVGKKKNKKLEEEKLLKKS